MMDIIRAEEAAQPVCLSFVSPPIFTDRLLITLQKISREAVLNPYESSDNPIARIPRSRPARAVSLIFLSTFVSY